MELSVSRHRRALEAWEALLLSEEARRSFRARRQEGQGLSKWVWIKIQPPGIGPQILVMASICVPFWEPVFDPQPNHKGKPTTGGGRTPPWKGRREDTHHA